MQENNENFNRLDKQMNEIEHLKINCVNSSYKNNYSYMDEEKNRVVGDGTKEIKVELPSTLTKIAKKVSELEERLYQNKKEATDIYNEMKDLEKLVERYVFQYEKKIIKENEPKPRTPSGFAAPTHVSDELCEFMGKDKGTLISRTEMSGFLYKYIKENRLNDPIKKNIIVPDTKLSILLGELSHDMPLTHFTIQKYISKHFYGQGKNSNFGFNNSRSSSQPVFI